MVARRAWQNQRLAIKPGARTAALEPLNRKIIFTLRPTWGAYGKSASLKFHVWSGGRDGVFDFHNTGEFRANGGAQFGGNIHVSWGGRTATFHENGDVAGPIWGGALSGWLNNQLNNCGTKNTAQKAQDGWWQCGDTGVIEQWGLANAVGDYVTIRFPREFSSGCWNVVITPVDADNKIHVRERSRTSFNVYTSVSLSGKRFFWRAIGE